MLFSTPVPDDQDVQRSYDGLTIIVPAILRADSEEIFSYVEFFIDAGAISSHRSKIEEWSASMLISTHVHAKSYMSRLVFI
jgi:hypothetical protein